jgi:hypothetical protein
MQAEPFVDVPSYDWAYEPVTMLYQMDIMKITVAAPVSFNDKNQISDWANKFVLADVQAGGYND